MTTNKIESTTDTWENRDLGASAEYVRVASAEHEFALDRALDLQSISIRLPKQLIDQYKLIAHFHGVGYQPLMRDILARFVPGALQEIMQAQIMQAKAAVAAPLVGSVKTASARPVTSKPAARKVQRKAA